MLIGPTIVTGILIGLRKNPWTLTLVEHANAWQAEQTILIGTDGQAIATPRQQKWGGAIRPE